MNDSLEILDQLRGRITDNDLLTLEKHLNEEKRLDSLRRIIIEKIDQSQKKMDQDWEYIGAEKKSQLITELQRDIFQLQLIEHAAKEPMLNIAKTLFSANPARGIQRETSPDKLKPPKRRKNELLPGSSNEEASANKRSTTREAKLVFAMQPEMRTDNIDEPTSSASSEPGRRGAKVKRNMQLVKNNQSAPSLLGKKGDDIDLGEVEESDHGNQMKKSSSPNDIEEDSATAIFPVRPNGQQQDASSSPGTRARKRVAGRDAGGLAETGGRSPRKRAEKQRNSDETNGLGKDNSDGREQQGRQTPTTDEPTYCLCEQVSFGDMICCDCELCSVEWFHFACVSIKSKPKGRKWYCPLCRGDKPNLLKPELQQKLDEMKMAQGE